MLKVQTLEIGGLRAALEALRLPFGRDVRSSIKASDAFPLPMHFTADSPHNIYHSSSYRVYWDVKDMNLLCTLIKRGDEHAKVMRGIVVWAKITAPLYFWSEMETYVVGHQRLSSESTMHIDCKGLSGEELERVKGEIPSSRELTKVDYFSYQALRRIYFQRRNHRLPIWHEFTAWIETLPYADLLITNEFNNPETQE